MCVYSCSPCLGVTAHALCSHASSHPSIILTMASYSSVVMPKAVRLSL